MEMHLLLRLILVLAFPAWGCSGGGHKDAVTDTASVSTFTALVKEEPKRVKTGAEIFVSEKLSLIRNKKVAIVANQTSLLPSGTHIVDTLHSLGIQITKVFAPEHGFRGDHDAGKAVASTKDARTGIPLVSLYGENKKPSAAMLADVDVVLFDIQDVGARFYTYISTLSYVMEACAENSKQVIVLDRPNPNGWYVDGPVLESDLESFVGMHPVPIVHGMTVGEYARMANDEGWLKGKVHLQSLNVVLCEGYTHTMKWDETGLNWIPPSPNLSTEYAAYLYPMLCWYEGMPVSVGRGTEQPFTLVGAPWHKGFWAAIAEDSMKQQSAGRTKQFGLEMEHVKFTPRSIPGKSEHPVYENQVCYGARFLNRVEGKELFLAGIALLLNFEEESRANSPGKPLFQPFFDKIAGTASLKTQLQQQLEPEVIYEGWQAGISNFKKIRKRYLLYPDFE